MQAGQRMGNAIATQAGKQHWAASPAGEGALHILEHSDMLSRCIYNSAATNHSEHLLILSIALVVISIFAAPMSQKDE